MTLEETVAELARTALIVEAPGGLWHLRARNVADTLCDQPAGDWPIVIHWAERSGITCGICLIAAGLVPAPRSSRRV